MIIKSDSSNTVDLTIGGNLNAWLFGSLAADTITVVPGGTCVLIAPDADGYPVTATTGDILDIVNGAASSSYTITLIGTE